MGRQGKMEELIELRMKKQEKRKKKISKVGGKMNKRVVKQIERKLTQTAKNKENSSHESKRKVFEIKRVYRRISKKKNKIKRSPVKSNTSYEEVKRSVRKILLKKLTHKSFINEIDQIRIEENSNKYKTKRKLKHALKKLISNTFPRESIFDKYFTSESTSPIKETALCSGVNNRELEDKQPNN